MIRIIIALMTITLCACATIASAQPADTVGITDNGIDSETVNVTVDDTTANIADADGGDSGNIDAVNLDDDELLQAAIAVDSVKTAQSTQKLDLIRREHEYKKQTRAAIIMMLLIALAMSTSQSWNPR
jgi:hypothetical protein